jgi:hypothetical protein
MFSLSTVEVEVGTYKKDMVQTTEEKKVEEK